MDITKVCCALYPEDLCDQAGSGTWQSTVITSSQPASSIVTISLPCDSNQVVTGVRYAWRESPCPLEECAVYSVENSLPSPPFKVDQYIPLEVEINCGELECILSDQLKQLKINVIIQITLYKRMNNC